MDRKATDKRLQRTYGITLEQYEQMLKENDGGCWICGWKPGPENNALAVDHDHARAKMKILVENISTRTYGNLYRKWRAWGEEDSGSMVERELRRDAISDVRTFLLSTSVRGLVCWACNTLLKKGRDNPEILESAARYLRKYKEKFGK